MIFISGQCTRCRTTLFDVRQSSKNVWVRQVLLRATMHTPPASPLTPHQKREVLRSVQTDINWPRLAVLR